MELEELKEAVRDDAALRRRQRLQPAGGQGDKIFPPTYPGANNSPTHVFELRRIDGEEKICVLIDSVQSQANRMEESLLAAAQAGGIRLPRLVVDFPGSGINSVPAISVLEAPHRVFDAILRDSLHGDKPFRDSDLGQSLRLATPADATAIFEAAPTALLFGAWNSTGEGGGLGAKFARVIMSEVIAVDVPAGKAVDSRTGDVIFRNAGRRTGSRIDPLGIPRSIEVFKDSDGDWAHDKADLGKSAKAARPSEINHGNIAPTIDMLGVTCDHALQTVVVSFAGLRRLRFGADPERDLAARTYLAALGIAAAVEADRQGRAFRSRCDLVCDGLAPLEVVAADGGASEVLIDPDAATRLHEAAFDAACSVGFALNPEPIMLEPQRKLVDLIRKAQDKALSDEASGNE